MGQEQSLVGDATPPETLSGRNLAAVAEYIKSGRARRIVVMTGAGISTAAGIPDFRSPDTGLYSNLARLNLPYAEAVFDIQFFRTNPDPFYVLARELYPGRYHPTLSHAFIALLAEKGLLLHLFTQNIDCLERAAGVPADLIVEAHGSFATQRCIDCHSAYPDDLMRQHVERGEVPRCLALVDDATDATVTTTTDTSITTASATDAIATATATTATTATTTTTSISTTTVTTTNANADTDAKPSEEAEAGEGEGKKQRRCNGLVKPDIVFFGESLPPTFFSRMSHARGADLVLVLGTSLTVYPFAGLPDEADERVPRVLFNLERVGSLGCRPDDVLVLKDCDSGVLELADALGWRSELEASWRGVVGDEEARRQLDGMMRRGRGRGRGDDELLRDEVEKLVERVDEALRLDDDDGGGGEEPAANHAGDHSAEGDGGRAGKVEPDAEDAAPTTTTTATTTAIPAADPDDNDDGTGKRPRGSGAEDSAESRAHGGGLQAKGARGAAVETALSAAGAGGGGEGPGAEAGSAAQAVLSASGAVGAVDLSGRFDEDAGAGAEGEGRGVGGIEEIRDESAKEARTRDEEDNNRASGSPGASVDKPAL